MVGFKTVKDVSLKGKRVLLRADFNVPIEDGVVVGDFRLRQTLPTIEYILKQKPALLIIISHLGRPAGQPDNELSLRPVGKELARLLDKEIHFIADCVGEHTRKAIAELKPGSIALLENLRFHAGEENNDHNFAEALVEASAAEIFVQDGFGVVHRAHASTEAITNLMPSFGGLLLEKEVETIEDVIQNPARLLTAIIGGVKIDEKIGVLKRFIELADCVAVVGALANNFLVAKDIRIGKSVIEADKIDLAEEIIELAEKQARKRPFKLLIPVDGVVSTSTDGRKPTRIVELQTAVLADVEAYPRTPPAHSHTVAADELILDIGPMSASEIVGVIEVSRTVVWSGTAGMAEVKGLAGAAPPFAHASRLIAEAMIGGNGSPKSKPFSLVGGGDTTAYIESEGLAEEFSFVSTGGSASLELMSGKKLPGIESLKARQERVL
ncbi:phosphoglycerate kinase [Candidatus Saccharibacteria bacterium RIFCSPHIGHO2_12_FULL_47_16b]|nr:MAG: phosphoglycerate kinase [Candidatus Saccharibacteria bacterium RIFCSPHIGHO2_12_FULL_47_16b]